MVILIYIFERRYGEYLAGEPIKKIQRKMFLMHRLEPKTAWGQELCDIPLGQKYNLFHLLHNGLHRSQQVCSLSYSCKDMTKSYDYILDFLTFDHWLVKLYLSKHRRHNPTVPAEREREGGGVRLMRPFLLGFLSVKWSDFMFAQSFRKQSDMMLSETYYSCLIRFSDASMPGLGTFLFI